MAFIKAQKIIHDENGAIISGSAAIVDTVYVSTGSKNHSRHKVRENLERFSTSVKTEKWGFLCLRPEVW